MEVIVALLVFCTGGLALAATAGAVARQFAVSERRMRAVGVARARAERAHATPCGSLGGGSEVLFGIESSWSTAATEQVARFDQLITRSDPRGVFTEQFLTGVACE